MRRFFRWYALLTKRLLRRPVFIILLLCVPLLAAAMAAVAKQDSSIVSVALVCDTDDPAARRAADRLLTADSMVRCTEYPSDAAARAALAGADVDAVWSFKDSTSAELARFVVGRGTPGAVVVTEREETVFLRLAREQLAAALYPEASYTLFRGYLIEKLGAPDDADELFDEYYNTRIAEDPIIVL